MALMPRTTLLSLAAAAVLSIVPVRSAAAQGPKVDFTGVYHSLSSDQEGSTWPAGWGVSVGIGTDRFKAVGEVSGHYGGDYVFHYSFSNYQVHTFQGGLEVAAKPTRVVTFARALVGGAFFTSADGNISTLLFTPEVGLKIKVSEHFGIHTALAFPILWYANDDARVWARVSVGVVYRK